LQAAPAYAQFPVGVLLRDTRPVILYVIYASIGIFWLVLALFAYIVCLRTYHAVRGDYRDQRKRYFRKGVELVLLEEPLEAVLEAFRPLRPFDTGISFEVMLESMRQLKGSPFETLREAAFRFGFMDGCLTRLRSRDRHERGKAMEALGVMKAEGAIVQIIDILETERLDLKLVALRALASIGDPVTLPYFVKTAQLLPPAMLTRVGSLMLEFGQPAVPHVQKLINMHPGAFAPRVLEEMLKIVAIDIEGYS